MQFVRYHNTGKFYDLIVSHLTPAYEAENCLMLGTVRIERDAPSLLTPPVFMGVLDDSGQALAFASQTQANNLIISNTSHPEALPLLAQEVHKIGLNFPAVLAERSIAHQFADYWQQITGYFPKVQMSERIYRLESVIPPQGISGHMRPATLGDRVVLRDWMTEFQIEAFDMDRAVIDVQRVERNLQMRLNPQIGGMYLWCDPHPVSMLGYTGRTPNGIRIGPVYTPPEYRGRGYASALTAAASQALLDTGLKFCFLFTDLANPTSNKIYQAIGYQPVCDADMIEFVPA